MKDKTINTKQKIIIFEGHDNSGKTILSTELSEALGIPRFKFSSCHSHFATKYDFLLRTYYDQSMFIEFLEQTGYSIILDRSYPSEYVYGRVFNRPVDDKFILELDERYSQLNTTIIICDKRDAFKGYKEDEVVDVCNLVVIKKTYKQFFKLTKCNTIFLDTTKQNLYGDIKTIIKFLGE